MDMLTEFPLLIPQDVPGRHYDGYIIVSKQRFRIAISLPPSGELRNAVLRCDRKLELLLHGFTDIIKQRLKQCTSLLSFLKELQSIINFRPAIWRILRLEWVNAERQLEGNEHAQPPVNSATFCRRIMSDMEQLGWHRLLYIESEFRQLHLQYTDGSGRNHVLKVTIGPKYPEEAPKCQADIPGKFDIHWTQKSGLCDVYEQFKQVVDSYGDFWAMMREIDKNTWVLEPENPTFSAVHRRLAISTSASMQITVDAHRPRAWPKCQLMGADKAVAPLGESMSSNIHLWNEESSVLENLQTIFNITFPSPKDSKKEDFSVDCGICYAYRLELQIPDQVCNEPRCGQAFHQMCLYEWLRALPSSRQSFNTIFGECPYCEKAITVKMGVQSS